MPLIAQFLALLGAAVHVSFLVLASLRFGRQADSGRETVDCPCLIGLLAALDADKRSGKYIKNAFGCVTITERVSGLRHRAILVRVRKQLFASRNDRVDLCPDQASCSSLDGLRTLCRIAKNENRFSEGRRFFLDAAGIGKNDVSAVHRQYERFVAKRLNKPYTRM